MRGLFAGVLALALLDAVIGSPQGPENTSGLLLGASRAVAAFLSPSVPAFRRKAGGEEPLSPQGLVPAAAADYPSPRLPGLPFSSVQPVRKA